MTRLADPAALPISIENAEGRRNRLWSRALDGRVVSSHFLWIETSSEGLNKMLRTELSAPCVRTTRCCEVVAETASESGKVLAAGSRDLAPGVRESAQRALEVLTDARMTTFLLLAGGVVPIGHCAAGPDPVGIQLDDMRSPDCTAEAFLAWASRIVLTRWQATLSAWVERGQADQPLRDLEAVIALQTLCLQFEYYQRSIPIHIPWRNGGQADSRIKDLASQLISTPPTAIFTTSPNESIVAELVSYHYPFWDRPFFCFNSPWDSFHAPSHS